MKHVLVVDAVATNLKCAVEVLKDQYQVTTSKSGVSALEFLKETTPDLILLDVNMPQMDGFAVFEWLQSKPELMRIPVIFQSVDALDAKKIEELQLSEADFVHKPYNPDDLRSRVEKILTQQRIEQSKLQELHAFHSFEEQRRKLEEEILRTDTGSLVVLHINQSDEVIQKFGNVIAEDILFKIIQILKEEAGKDGSIYCIDNARFAVFFADNAEQENVKTIVRRMIAGVEFEVGEIYAEELEVRISLSAGIARKPEDGHSYTDLYDCADKALYFLKQSGKRGYYFYSMEQSDVQISEEKKEPLYVIQIQRMLSDGRAKGEEQESFEKACQLLSLYLKSKKQKAQVLWFRVSGKPEEEKQQAIRVLGSVITDSLRKGDMAIPCGDNQYMVILFKTSKENGERVAERIHKKWKKELPTCTLALTDEIKSV